MKEFIIAHKNEIVALAIPLAWALANEFLAHNPKVASNSVVQALMAGLKKLKDKASTPKSDDTLPPAA